MTATMNKASMEQAARDEFWVLDGTIKATEAEIAVIDVERNALAEEEAVMRTKVRDIGVRKMKIVKNSSIAELTKERSRYAVFLNRKTGTKENH